MLVAPMALKLLGIVGVALATVNLGSPQPARADEDATTMRLYVGTYTAPGKSQGIYQVDFDPATGALSNPRLAARTESPSFLALAPSGRFLYAVNEVGSFGDKPGGGLSAFEVDASGSLKALNAVNTRGGAPCHLAVSPDGTRVFVANYSGGSAIAFALGSDGRIGETTGFRQHQGQGVNPRRQEGPHAHGTHLSPDGTTVAVPDLGLDTIMLYQASDGSLAAAAPNEVAVSPGSGPRHLAYNADGSRAYVIQEMGNTISVFDTKADPGWKSLQTIPTLPSDFVGESTTAEVALHPSGTFLYGSNRGHDSLAIYSVDPSSGLLTLVGHEPTGGKTPRHFTIDPTGQWLLVALQDSDAIVVFGIDPATGQLRPTENRLTVSAPVCLLLAD